VETRDKKTLETMIEALDIFEQLQASISEDFWQKLTHYLGEHNQITWTDISNFKECLERFSDLPRRQECRLPEAY